MNTSTQIPTFIPHHIVTLPISRSSIFMDFEFQESDIVFTDQNQAKTDRSSDEDKHGYCGFRNMMVVPILDDSWAHGKSQKKKEREKRMTNSPPVDIPETFIRSPESDYEFKEGDDEGEVVPPHLIVRQRVAARMASLVCSSHGRTLKGRHLSEVRNSILRMTGFLES
ncbi:protein S40-1-like [Syzygium oleosum]|uniref:protein S40-1-like n=1 Tax=Syzygium oleosum TaxID=219896 RepID=UPI0024B90FCA|nr:protein S40-1-like [Syzygium oleosum]